MKKVKMVDCNEIDALISDLRDSATVAGLHFDIWSVLTSPDTQPKYEKTIDRYRSFFSTTRDANFVAALITLYRLYETHASTKNVSYLLKLLRDCFDESKLTEIEALNAEAIPIFKKVNILRNNVFAHRSISLSVEDAYLKAGITPREISRLIEITQKLLNAVFLLHNNVDHRFNLCARTDTVSLLNRLSAV